MDAMPRLVLEKIVMKGVFLYDNGAKTEKEDGTEGSSLNEEKLVIKKTWL